MSSAERTRVVIAPQFRGHITPRGLIEPQGTVEFSTDYSQVGGAHAGVVCGILSDDYQLEIGFTRTHFYIRRNSQLLESPLHPLYGPTGNVHFFAMWDLDQLSVIVLDKTFFEAVERLTDPEKAREVEKRRHSISTPPTVPPNRLLSWARRQVILPTVIYGSVASFNEVVASSLEGIADQITALGSNNPFWDISYRGSTIVARKPKHEPDIHPTIHSLLYYIAIAKSLEVTPEYLIGGGSLDFLFSGPLASGGIASVCVEFKCAHSEDIEDGLLKQLPAYMRAKGCDFGIYCVLYFKGRYFTRPQQHDLLSLRIHLEGLRRRAGLARIRTLMLDVSHRPPPSKLQIRSHKAGNR